MVSQRFSLLAVAIVALAGLALAGLGFLVQLHRLRLYLAQGIGFHDPACSVPYCDYSVFWLAGLLARHGDLAALYNSVDFLAFSAAMLPNHTGGLSYFYPPTGLLPVALVTLPPLVIGYYLFTAATLLLGALMLHRARLPWWVILAGILSPAAAWNIYLGQFGFICAVLLICGLACLKSRPILAGILLGLLCIKPQYALLVPVAVLASRNWRAMLSGTVTLAAAIALSLLCFGWQAWTGYLSGGRAQMAVILNAPFGVTNVLGDSVFWMMRSFGAALATAYAMQILSALLAIAVTWRIWRSATSLPPINRIAATVCLTLLASPYGYTDDLTGYSLMLPALARRDPSWRNVLIALLWIAPAFTMRFVQKTGVSPTALLVIAALAVAMTVNTGTQNSFRISNERRMFFF